MYNRLFITQQIPKQARVNASIVPFAIKNFAKWKKQNYRENERQVIKENATRSHCLNSLATRPILSASIEICSRD